MIVDHSSFTRKKIKIQPFEVEHYDDQTSNRKPVKVPALGYKFTHNKKSILYGGDTAYCDNLAKMAKGSDLAIIEAGAEYEGDKTHLSVKEAKQIGETAKEYFLVHMPG